MQVTFVNQIWQHNHTLYRVLYFSQELEEIFWVDINHDTKLPEQISVEKFLELKSNNKIKLIDHTEEYNNPDNYGEKSITKWNRHWKVVEFLAKAEPQVFIDFYFHVKCRELAAEYELSRQTIERIVLKYWKRGMSKLALLPDLNNSGGKGKAKKVGLVKRGRPGKYTSYSVNIDTKLAKEIKAAYNRFYLQVEQASLKTAYLNFLRVKYPSQVKKNDLSNVPTFTQFKYWGEKFYDAQDRLMNKKGSKIFNKDLRIISESSIINTIGPGSLYQIDSTKADIELVSSIDRQIPIGGPTLYFVSDVFSRMIVGVLVTLDEPSYYTGARALYNTMISKSQLCKEEGLYEIDNFKISDQKWPCHYLPDAIVADRAELLGNQSNNIIRDLGITIENTPAYRADLKGVVENLFKVIHTKIKGLADKRGFKSINPKQRGVRDARKDAIITLKEYYAIIIKEVISYNNSKVLESYPLEKDMIIDDVSPVPIELWTWGIQNRSGRLRSNNISNLKEKLLPKSKAKLSKEGVYFKKGWYNVVHRKVKNKQLLLQDKKMQLDVSFDPFNLSKIHIHFESELIECHVSKSRSKLYFNANVWEIDRINELNRKNIYEKNIQSMSQSIESLDFAESVFQSAEKQKKKKTNKSIKAKNIRENKNKEKELNRQEKAKIENQTNEKEVKVIPMNSENNNLSNNKKINYFKNLMDHDE